MSSIPSAAASRAFDEKPVRICREVALAVRGRRRDRHRHQPENDGRSCLLCQRRRFPLLDFNDVMWGASLIHPSDHIAACLAVAEAERASGKDLIAAIMLAYEVNCRLIDALDISTRGWDPPVLSLPAVALAAGKLMKLAPTVWRTQSISPSMTTSRWARRACRRCPIGKGLADAEAGRNAVFRRDAWRAAGSPAPAPIFEGELDSFSQVIRVGRMSIPALFGRRGVPFRIHQCGMKRLSGGGLQLRPRSWPHRVAKEVGALDRIAAIEIATTKPGLPATGREPEKWSPKTRDTADHSLPYITARPCSMATSPTPALRRTVSGSANPRLYAEDHGQRGSCRLPRAGWCRGSYAGHRDSRRRTGGSSREVDVVPGFLGPADEPSRSRAEVSRAMSASAGRRSGRTRSCKRCGRSIGPTISPRSSADWRCNRAISDQGN